MDQLGLLGLSENTSGQIRQTLSGSSCKYILKIILFFFNFILINI